MPDDRGTELSDLGRSKIRQIFRFLKDFNALRNPVRRQISEHPWFMWLHDLPNHPCVWLRSRQPGDPTGGDESGEILLRVRRPDIPDPPPVPKVLDGWLPNNWKDVSIKSVEPVPERETTGADGSRLVEKFDAVQDRIHSFARWKMDRNRWAGEALLAKQVLEAFNRLYELQGRLEREGESVQLTLGQGILVWRQQEGDIRHPIIAQRLQLSFDPYIPEFKIVETDQPPELLRSLLVSQTVAAETIQRADEELAAQDLDLLDVDKIGGLLRRVSAALHAGGQFLGDKAPQSVADYPQIGCDPVIYLHQRTQGFAAALDYVLEDLRNQAELPAALLRISGIEVAIPEVAATTNYVPWEEPAEILFTKEANEEQIQIGERLTRYGNVLVQGPPGTGKTHTIANLIGHLLAQGQRVLVTAHTSKALRVVRDKVVEPLQTLCVSVLDNETESRKQLEASVDEMVARLTRDDPVRLDREADAAEAERTRLMAELSQLQRMLIESRQDEYRELVNVGVSISPSSAARFVAEAAESNAWIPSPIEPGVPAPLSDDEFEELYATNDRIDIDEEVELARWRPAPGEVPGAKEFVYASDRWRALQASDRTVGAEFWSDCVYDATEEELALIERRIHASVQLLADAPAWKLDVIGSCMAQRSEAMAPWNELIARIEDVLSKSQASLGLLLDYRCSLGSSLPADRHRALAREIQEFLESGGKLSPFRILARPVWRKFLSSVRVNDEEPRTATEFRAVEAYANLTEARKALGMRWTNQVTLRGGPRWEDFGRIPEEGVALLSSQIRTLLGWHTNELSPLLDALGKVGFNWDAFINAQQLAPGEHVELRRLVSAVVGPLPQIVAARIAVLNIKALDRQFQRWHRALFSADPNSLPASPVLNLRNAISAKDYREYDAAFRCLADLHTLGPIFERRRSLVERLRPAAPRWATAIDQRIPPHVSPSPPGSGISAWKWLQFRQELERRASISIPGLQERIREIRGQIRRTTARLIEVRSWSAQCKRVGLEERQALQGWKDINRRIGRGTGRRAPGLRVEARRTLAKARNAVPVWIMPLSRVAETFDPRVTRFDVVIVDESSQCDVMGLLALYLAKQAIVVGDHEQVSPLAIGQEIAEVERLIDQHLGGIPNSRLYDGKMSLYDLARQSFGGVIRLVEHFRCMPEIISFSNAISYNGAIKPLRDPASTHITPQVVSCRVAGVRNRGKVNAEEARTVAALLQAAMEQPEYRGKTFGAVSLLGEEQAIEIERWVRQISSPGDLVAGQFLCGTAAHFQGDERDVVFISLVDSPSEGPLARRDVDLYRQRFNVAASRPKDQLWVVHSLDPGRDLQPGDLRRRLIEHADNPGALSRIQLAQEGRTESEFERLVLQRLLNAGFRVTPQWVVGHYRIDLVVQGSGRRLAVECDGDRFHPVEKVAEDMARQATLERLGWRFVRIRGSQFFRDPDGAMKPLFETLGDVGIAPEGHADVAAPVSSGGDLVERVKRRAADILQERDIASTAEMGH
jgi:very-short-patch-repair endonuclease